MFQNPYEIGANQEIGVMGKRLEGEVISHHPTQNGLVQIKIKGLHDGWPNDCIPYQQAEQGYGAGNNQAGKVGEIPPVGAKTYSRFLSDNQYHPVYTAGPSSDDKKIDDFTNEKVYPYAYGSVDQGGHKEVVNTKEGEESYSRSHVKGSNFGIDKDGNINHSSAAKLMQMAKEVMMQAAEGVMLSGKSGHLKFDNLILEGKSIEIRGAAKSTVPITLGAAGPGSVASPTLPSAGKRPSFSSGNKSGGGSSSGSAST